MIRRTLSFLVLAAATLLVAVPAASAATYTVNVTGDQSDADVADAVCDVDTGTAGNQCTLRAAADEANAEDSPGADAIAFDASVFQGVAGSDTITIAGSIGFHETITIDGGDCGTTAPKPCVGLHATSNGEMLSIASNEAQGSRVSRLAFTSATNIVTALSVFSDDFSATGNWFGLTLDETASQPFTGIAVSGDDAAIGGTTPADRNVFGRAFSAVSLGSGTGAVVSGNYIGLAPDGDADPAFSTIVAIRMHGTDVADITIGGPDAGTPDVCDGACNAFGPGSSRTFLFDGGGTEEVAGAIVAGNFIGFEADGTPVTTGVLDHLALGASDDVSIGGLTAAHGNRINGGSTAIGATAGATGLEIRNNHVIGAQTQAIVVDGPATIADNRISGAGGPGVELLGNGASVTGNTFDGGTSTGLRLVDASDNTIAGNRFGTESDGSVGTGIVAFGDSDDNVIGGDVAADENVFQEVFNVFDPVTIEISGDLAIGNEVRRNRAVNSSADLAFLDLTDGANGGAPPPVITTATEAAVSGTAPAGAVVRVFRKDTENPGELAAFVGQATAGSGGAWSVAACIDESVQVAASQTTQPAGTSELAYAPVTEATCPAPGDGGDGGDDGGGGNPPATTTTTTPPAETTQQTPVGGTDGGGTATTSTLPGVGALSGALALDLSAVARRLRALRGRRLARTRRAAIAGAGPYPLGGTLSVRAVGRRATVLRGTRVLAAGEQVPLTVRATAAGRRLLRTQRRLVLTLRATFTDGAGRTVTATRKVTLRR